MHNIIRLFFFITMSLVWVVNAHAASLSADQLRMVKQLSPQDKASLAKQYGVALPSCAQAVQITPPKVVKPRKLSQGVLEKNVGPTTDGKIISQDIVVSAKVNLPIEKVKNQAATDNIELRDAFTDFVREPKPLQVDTTGLKQFGCDLFAAEKYGKKTYIYNVPVWGGEAKRITLRNLDATDPTWIR